MQRQSFKNVEINLSGLALGPHASAPLLRTDARPYRVGGAARKGEGKVNSLIGMSAIPQTYLTPKSWEPRPKSDTFQSGGRILWQWWFVICCQPRSQTSVFSPRVPPITLF